VGIGGSGNEASVAHPLSDEDQATYLEIQDFIDDYQDTLRQGNVQAAGEIYQGLVRLVDRVFGENETVPETVQNFRRINNVNIACLNASEAHHNIGRAFDNQDRSFKEQWGALAIRNYHERPSHSSIRQAQRNADEARDAVNQAIRNALLARSSSADVRVAQLSAMSSYQLFQLVQAWAHTMSRQEINPSHPPYQGDQWHYIGRGGARGREPEGGARGREPEGGARGRRPTRGASRY